MLRRNLTTSRGNPSGYLDVDGAEICRCTTNGRRHLSVQGAGNLRVSITVQDARKFQADLENAIRWLDNPEAADA